jgi:hypothetical protein
MNKHVLCTCLSDLYITTEIVDPKDFFHNTKLCCACQSHSGRETCDLEGRVRSRWSLMDSKRSVKQLSSLRGTHKKEREQCADESTWLKGKAAPVTGRGDP